MPRRFIVFLAVTCLLLTACTEQETLTTTGAAQLAQEVREGAVGANLDLLLAFVDRLAPISEARDLLQAAEFAALAGCSLTGDVPYTIVCSDIDVGGERATLSAQLEFLAGGEVTDDPSEADALRVILEGYGDLTTSEGVLVCTPDPDLGMRIQGMLTTEFFDGTLVTTWIDDLYGRTVADLPDLTWGVLFTQGSVDLLVLLPDELTITGTAALAGRNAFVAIEIDGSFSHGDIALGP